MAKVALDQLDITEKENRADAGLPRDVYALLAQANLLRMRGCWEEAVQNCMAAMRLAPESPSAQSLLGDIYENQGRHDDAIQWYRMALDVNPDSPADQLKLNRLLRLQQEVTPRASDVVPSEVTEREPALRWNAEITLRYAAILSALLVILVVSLAYLSVHRHAALAALGMGGGQEMEVKPVLVPSEGATTLTSSLAGGARDASEQALLDALKASPDLTAQGISVYDVQTDPRASSIAVTFGVASRTPTAASTREAILQGALRTIQAAASASGGQSASVVHCALPQSSLWGRGHQQRRAGFCRGHSAQRDSRRRFRPMQGWMQPRCRLAVFANPWWSTANRDLTRIRA